MTDLSFLISLGLGVAGLLIGGLSGSRWAFVYPSVVLVIVGGVAVAGDRSPDFTLRDWFLILTVLYGLPPLIGTLIGIGGRTLHERRRAAGRRARGRR